jgi:hypothetical protein
MLVMVGGELRTNDEIECFGQRKLKLALLIDLTEVVICCGKYVYKGDI